MVDINCRLKVVFKGGGSNFFIDDDSLNLAIEKEKIQKSMGKVLIFMVYLCFAKTEALCLIIKVKYCFFQAVKVKYCFLRYFVCVLRRLRSCV